MSTNSDKNNTSPQSEIPCPYCRSLIDRHSTACKYCQKDLSDFVSLDNVDLNDLKSVKAMLTILIRKSIWRDTIKVLLSSAVFVTAVTLLISSYQKYSITDDLSESIKRELSSDLRKDIKTDILLDLQAGILEVKSKITALSDDIDKVNTKYENKLERFETDFNNKRELLQKSYGQLGAEAQVAQKELEGIEGSANKLRRIITEYEQQRETVVNALIEIRGKSSEYETKLRTFEMELSEKSQQLNPLVSSVSELSTQFTNKLQDATAIASQIRDIEKKFELAILKLRAQESRAQQYVTINDLEKISIQKDKQASIQFKAATPILTYPVSGNSGQLKTLIKPNIEFTWLLETDAEISSYKLQLSNSKDAILNMEKDEVTEFEGLKQPNFSINSCKQAIKVARACISGSIFWRVAVIYEDNSAEWSEISGVNIYSSTLAKVKSTGKVMIGYAHNPPYFFRDESNNLSGFEFKLSEEIFKSIKTRGGTVLVPEYIELPFNELFDAIKDHRVDLIISSISRTEIRKTLHEIDFSIPYMKSAIDLVTKELDISTTTPIEQLIANMNVSVEQDTIHSDIASSYGAKTTELNTASLAIDHMLNGFSEGAIVDSKILKSMNINDEIKVISIKDDSFGVVVKNNDEELLKLINEKISRLKQDNKLLDLQKEFFAKL